MVGREGRPETVQPPIGTEGPRPAAGDKTVRRLFLLIFLPLALLVAVVAAIVDMALIRADTERMAAQDMALVRLASGEFIAELRPPLRHLRSLPGETAVHAGIDSPTPETLAGMTVNFITLLQRNPAYDQVRWIDESGWERVRIDKAKDGGAPVAVAAEKLQDKSARPYFQEANRLEMGRLYISELDLNVENGKVEIPHKPTLRVATPVADGAGRRRGILIINILMAPSLENFIRRTDGRIMLVNRRGEWMYGPDDKGGWGYRFERSPTLASHFPEAWARIRARDSGQFVGRDGLWSWDLGSASDLVSPELGLSEHAVMPEPYWLTVSHRSAEEVRALSFAVWRPTLMIAVPLVLVFAAMCQLIAVRSKQQREASARSAVAQAVAEEQRLRMVEMERVQKHIATLAAIVESSDDAIVSKDLDSKITSWNPGAERLFGYRADEVVGRSMTLLFPAGTEHEEHEIITRIAAGETVKHFEGRRRHKDGHLIDVSITISPIHDREGRVVGASKVARDITERKRQMEELALHREHLEELVAERTVQIRETNQRLEEALEEAEVASRAKSRFLANMSHEIRTPMNAVLGFLALVLEGELPDTVRRQLVTAHNSAKSLLLLLNDILDISKLQSGKIELEQIPFSLPRVLRSSLEMLQIRARDKKLEMQLLYPSDMAQCYVGDPMRIRQIVTNLVGNAIKFTDSGAIVVSMAQGDEPGMVELSVRDTGIGMTTEQAEKILTPFVQADSSTTRRFGGTGLGVSICKQLAEIMGGRIWIDSEEGVGSTFHVLLHLGQSASSDDCPDEGFACESAVQSLRRFQILLVDDIEENIELAEARLTAQGHVVTVARNGRKAVELADIQAFDLILMDVHMPDMNGLDATREIRRRQQGHDYQVPIIALTASVLLSEQQQCFAVGMNAFTGKPIDFCQLIRLMENVVPPGRGEAVSGLALPLEQPSPTLPALAGIDVAAGLRRWGDLGRYGAALAGFSVKYADIGDRLARLHASGDWVGARELAHALKGVAGNLAVIQVARAATALNEAFKARQSGGIDVLLAELAQSWAVATASVDSLQRQLPTVEDIADDVGSTGKAVPPAVLEELRAALATDDPGEAEAALDRFAAVMPHAHALQMRQLIAEFEFDEARALLLRWVESEPVPLAETE